MADEDFWTDLTQGPQIRTSSSLDAHLQGRDIASRGLRVLTDRGRAEAALSTPVEAGTRVQFVTNIGSVLTYANPPTSGTEGTVVMVRTAEGDRTGTGDVVFVKFDDESFLAVHREHLRRASGNSKTAASFALRVSSLGDLSGFLRRGQESDDDLVHRATRDLWSYQETEDGDFVIARLFNDTGEPLRV
jgi:hypothetical protein